MKHIKKRLLSVLLCIIVVAGTFAPTNAIAESGSELSSSEDQIGDYFEADSDNGSLGNEPKLSAEKTSKSYADGWVLTNKTITPCEEENEFLITLDVRTKEEIKEVNLSEDAATVIVLDLSGSMKTDNRIGAARSAAKEFVNSFKTENSSVKRKIAVVGFSGNKKEIEAARTYQDWTDVTDDSIGTISTSIDEMIADGGTCLQAGLILAKNLLNDGEIKDIANKNIVVLTDGKPTFHLSLEDSAYTATDVILSSEIKGTGNQTEHDTHIKTEKTAKSILNSGINVYSVFLGTETVECIGNPKGEDIVRYEDRCSLNKPGADWMREDCGFITYAAKDANKLEGIFKEISELIQLQATAWIADDPIGVMFEFDGFVIEPEEQNQYFYNSDSKKITWNLRLCEPVKEKDYSKYTLTYKIKLNTLADHYKSETYYPTNGVTSVTYFIEQTEQDITSKIESGTAYFNVPSAKGYAVDISFTKVNEDGTMQLTGAAFKLSCGNWIMTDTSDTDGMVEFNDVPSGHEYTLEEITAPDGYEKADNIIIPVAFGVASGITEGIIKNHPISTSVNVKKVWNDNNDQDGKRPDRVTVKLLANGKEVDGKILTLSSANEWKGSFTGLPLMNEGRVITYFIEEEAVEGYTTTISENNNSFVITNTHSPETISVSGSKIWDDDNNRDGKRPESITINLLKNGEVTAVKEVTSKDSWSWTFAYLPKYEAGKEIVYSISENTVEGYTPEINGYNIKNTYTPGKTSVSVTKNWQDENNKDGIRPNEIKVYLLANGEAVKDKNLILNGGNKWIDYFTDLPVYQNGKKISYTVDEENVDGYSKTISGDAISGFTITNTHTPKVNPPLSPIPPAPIYYTVTYNDGVDGEVVFADQVNSGLVFYTLTPGFNGTPIREGYVFKGWSPVVADRVTEDAYYHAIWEKVDESESIPQDENLDGGKDPKEPVESIDPSKPFNVDKGLLQENSDIPNTGDQTPLATMIGLLIASAGALGALCIKKRKSN